MTPFVTTGFLSDVHGRLDALEAVLARFERAGVQRVVACGDLLLGGPEPLGVWRRLQQVGAVVLAGLGEMALVQVDPDKLRPLDAAERARVQRFAETRRAIGDLVVQQLRSLPRTWRTAVPGGGELVAVHGAPADPTEAITHDLTDEEVLALLGSPPPRYVVCGAAHVPFQRTVAGTHLVALGSVGEAPEGEPNAHYAIARPQPDGLQWEAGWTPY